MAILKSKEIRRMSEKERKEKMKELKNELLKMRTLVAGGGTIESPGRIFELRRTIARIHTINREDELNPKSS